jgi:small subunit ribosomal protein S8
MMVSDPIADMLTRIRNAIMARHEQINLPGSKMKRRIAEILEAEGYVSGVEWEQPRTGLPQGSLTITLKWDGRDSVIDGLKRISTPGCRIYAGRNDIPRVRNGLGVSIVSTSRGLMTDRDARTAGIGGEVLCSVW